MKYNNFNSHIGFVIKCSSYISLLVPFHFGDSSCILNTGSSPLSSTASKAKGVHEGDIELNGGIGLWGARVTLNSTVVLTLGSEGL